METTVTAMFADRAAAQRAVNQLERAGFPQEQIEVIDGETENRHTLIGEETSDVARGAQLGAAVGGVGMAIGGVAMALPPLSLFDFHPVVAALLFGGLGAAGGLVIGVLVGSATGHQVQQEYEHMIEAGGVMLAVNTTRSLADGANSIMRETGGSMLSVSVHRRHNAAAAHSA